MNNRKVGTEKERLATIFLNANRVTIKEVNFACRFGEIDIIGYDNNQLVFFEVKYRKNNNKGYASDAVNLPKQKKICRVSDYYRYIHKISENQSCRFDVIAIDGNDIDWITNAFDYIPKY